MNPSLSPPPDRDLPPGRLDQRKEHLVAQLTIQRPPARTHLRATLVAAGLAVFLLCGAAVAYVATRPATELSSVGCYETPDLQANTTMVAADGRPPQDLCAQVWTEGAVADGVTQAPALTTCVLDSGAAAVFPGDPGETCAQLGLSELEEDGYVAAATQATQLIDLQQAVNAELGGPAGEGPCSDGRAAAELIRRGLDARDLGDWTVAAGGSGADLPCVRSVLVDEAAREVLMVAGASAAFNQAFQATFEQLGHSCVAPAQVLVIARRELAARGLPGAAAELTGGAGECTVLGIRAEATIEIMPVGPESVPQPLD